MSGQNLYGSFGNTIQVNQGGLFDEIQHTQGGHPHIMQYLWTKYCKYLQDQVQARQAKGLPCLSLSEALRKAPALGFVTWAAEFLKDCRPVQAFFVDENQGLILENNDCVCISPGVPVQGTMQDSGAVQVTEGRSREGSEGVIQTPALRI